MIKADRIFGVIGLLLSLWSFLESRRWDYMAEYSPGPGFFPFWLGLTLAIISCYLLYDTYRRKPSEEDHKSVLPRKQALYRIGSIMLVFTGVVVFMNTLGFTLAIALFVATILYVLEKYNIYKSIGYAIAYSATVWLVFTYMLEMNFPVGFLGI